ncbi:recombinase family protein [Sphingobium sp.]|uniref:recombinase family protein n=1 Tax=Sphingobium sp. TaxID=1912891 RepID=UPI002618FE84|nr:recombinase family protein [Sphingobium sp.]
MTQKAIIYARFSTLEQSKGYSLERQLKNGRAFVEKQKWYVERELTDEGKSAFHGSNRLEGTALHSFEAEARKGLHRGKTLCVENIDRLSRQGAKAAAQLVWALNEQGVDVATWHDGYVYKADGSGDLMELFSVIIKAQMAYEESLKKSQRSKDNWTKKYADIESGKDITFGGKPTWIDIVDGKHVLNKHRAEVINDMFDWYIDGLGYMAIVQKLNDRQEPVWHDKNYKDAKGGWQFSHVHRIINGRTVIGEFQKGGTQTIASDFYPPAVTLEKYNRAHAIRIGKPRPAGRDSKRKNNLLSGMVFCSECGKVAGYENKGNSLHRYVTKSGEVRLYPVTTGNHETLICDAYRRKSGCQNKQRHLYRVVEGAVLDTVLSSTFDDEIDTEQQQEARQRIAVIERDISLKTQQMSNLVDALADGGAKVIVARIATLEADIESLQSQLQSANDDALILAAAPTRSDDMELVAQLREELTSEDSDIRYYARTKTNAALKRIIDEINICPDGSFVVQANFAVFEFNADGKCIGGQAI